MAAVPAAVCVWGGGKGGSVSSVPASKLRQPLTLRIHPGFPQRLRLFKRCKMLHGRSVLGVPGGGHHGEGPGLTSVSS